MAMPGCLRHMTKSLEVVLVDVDGFEERGAEGNAYG